MSKLMFFAVQRPWMVLALVLLLSMLSAFQLPDLKLEISAEGMMVEDDPVRVFYQQMLDDFGSESISIVYVQDPDLFQAEKLSVIRDAVNRINASPWVKRTDSLFSRRYLRTIDGYIYTDPYLSKIPATPAEVEEIRQAALHNPLIARNLLSPDGTAMAINVYLDVRHQRHGSDQAVSQMLDEALAPLQNKLQTVFHVGDPYIRSGISQRIRQDQTTIVPLALLMLVATLIVALRHLLVAVIPLVTAGVSILWTLGLMAAWGIPVNIMTSIIPALLIIIGSTEDIHLLTEYQAGIRKGKKPRKALQLMTRNMGIAVTLTFVTTYFGFLSIGLNDLALLRQFGLIASTALALNFIATVLLVPAFLQLFGSRYSTRHESGTPDIFARIALVILKYIKRHRLQVGLSLLFLILIAGYGALQLRVNNNVMDHFSDESAFARYAGLLHANLSGMQTLSVVVSGPSEAFLRVRNLEQLQALQKFLEHSGKFDSSYSLADFIGVVHSGTDAEKPVAPYLPDRDEVVKAYSLMLDQKVLKPFVSKDFARARIMVRHNISSSQELNQAVARILTYARQSMAPDLSVQVTGESYLNNRAVDYMADGQARSLALMLLVIFLLVSFLFMQFKAGMIAVLANLFPIVMLFGVMGYLDVALDTGTAMVAAIAMGIAVDHSMHFIVRYQQCGQMSDRVLECVISREAAPIIATAIALAMGFATLSLSGFPPVARFGLLSALVMLLALISTFFILPLLLWHSHLLGVWDLLSVKVRKQVTDNCPLFGNMHNWQVRKILALSRLQQFRQDEAIFLQGQSAHYMRVLLEGEAEIWRTQVDGSTQLARTLQPGDVFGVTALMRTRQRRTDVVAIRPSVALALRWKDIHRIAKAYPRISSRLFENLTFVMADVIAQIESDRPQIKDELSGAYNATYFVDLLKFAVDKANRNAEQLSLMSLEVVHDNVGKQMVNWQDQARTIRKAAEFIRAALRKGDAMARWQERVFWVVLPNTDARQAELLVRRIREFMQQADSVADGHADIAFNVIGLMKGEEATNFVKRMGETRIKGWFNRPYPGVGRLSGI
ncbi:MMPL family transporter [Thiolapillus sp.]